MPLDDQVTMLVGVSVRHAVELEATLRSLLITLDPSFDSSRRWQFSQLVSTFRRLARTHPTFTSDARRACTVIATEVQAAYNHRSSNVHDMLGSYGDTSIERFRFERDTKIEYRDDPEVRSVDDLVQSAPTSCTQPGDSAASSSTSRGRRNRSTGACCSVGCSPHGGTVPPAT